MVQIDKKNSFWNELTEVRKDRKIKNNCLLLLLRRRGWFVGYYEGTVRLELCSECGTCTYGTYKKDMYMVSGNCTTRQLRFTTHCFPPIGHL